MEGLRNSALLNKVQQLLAGQAGVYLVGGAIRDFLLKKSANDLDFALAQDALGTARRVGDALGGAYYCMDADNQVGRVVLEDEHGERCVLDFAALQADTIEGDLRKRDFTVNAIAIDLSDLNSLIDPLGGAEDLIKKRLRACSPTALTDDPVRVLRAVRMSAKYGLLLQADVRQQISPAVELLPGVSIERQRDELFKILDAPKPAASIRVLDRYEALVCLLPELEDLKSITQSEPHIYDVWDHSLHAVQELERVFHLLDLGYGHDNEFGGDVFTGLLALHLGRYRPQITAMLRMPIVTDRTVRPLVYLAALYHDITKPAHRTVEEDGRIRFIGHEGSGSWVAQRRAVELHLSSPEVQRLATVVREHTRPWQLAKDNEMPSRRAVYRFWRATGEAGVDVCLLSIADLRAIYGHTLPKETFEHHLEVVRTLLEAYWEAPEQVSPPTLLNGDDLMAEFGLTPGPRIGELLEMLREAQAAGEVADRQQALAFIAPLVESRDP